MITADQVAHIKLFAGLDERHRAEIAAHAADIRLQAGEWLIHEGELPAFFGLISGRLGLLKELGSGEHVLGHHVTGDPFGELPLLLGSPAIAGLRAVKASRLLRLDPADFHRLVAERPELSSHLLRTMAHRIQHLQELSIQTPVAQVTIIGHRWDLDCHSLRDFLTRHLVAFTWADPESPTLNSEGALSAGGTETLPIVVLQDGTRLSRPSLRELAGALGLQTSPSAALYDVAIIGAGPAGLGAAVYGASEGLHTIVIDREAPGGQAGTSSRIENYLGFPAGLSGSELSSRALH
jgi:thioredoxin reductase (NADPH)